MMKPGSLEGEENTLSVAYKPSKTIFRIAKYSLVRLLALAVAVAIGVFASVVLINFGGFIAIVCKSCLLNCPPLLKIKPDTLFIFSPYASMKSVPG